jgi:hypothetical protein
MKLRTKARLDACQVKTATYPRQPMYMASSANDTTAQQRSHTARQEVAAQVETDSKIDAEL